MNAAQSGGDHGAGQGVALEPAGGDAFWWLGSLMINKVEGPGMSLVDHLVPPGYAPPLHIHHRQDEVFMITEGEFTMTCGDETWQAGPGAVIFLPRGIPHRFQASEAGPARTQIITVPGGFCELVAELGEPATELTLPGPDVQMPDAARVGAVMEAHGIEPVGPPPGGSH